MTPLHALAILAAGIAAGTINTVVGSGTLITFPTLLGFGYAPVVANVSNTIGLVPGSISGAFGYRQELAGQGTRVGALHVGFMDTDLTAGIDQPKSDPADIARIAVDGIAAGDVEILADEVSRNVRARLAGGVATLYPAFA